MAIAAAVAALSPVTMATRMPAVRHRATASATSARGGSSMPMRASSASSPVVAAASDAPVVPGSPVARATAITRRPRADRSASSIHSAPSGLVSTHRASSTSGAPMTYAVPPTVAALDIAAEVKGSRAVGATRSSGALPRLRPKASSAASIGSPSAIHRPSRWTARPLMQALEPTTASRSTARAEGGASTVRSGA